ncbi:MAG: RnfABCDGE type electron transport complex subunit D [Candidatus Omnitrophica bacterium]|nr:RnfABCDGE type electron transport complex subunit D [Candidatus Omnitrophota bacterium]
MLKIKSFSIKTRLIIFLAGFAVFLSIRDRDLFFLFTIAITLLSAIIADLTFSYFRDKSFVVSESSVVSALIIGFVLASDNPWWVISLAAIFAIISKHLIRFNKKHIFNPAAFGVFLSIIFLGANTQWKGTFLWYILVPAGLYFTYKIRKLELIAGYLITALGLFGIQAAVNKVSLINIFGYLSYFYIFIMLIEPKTTPIKPLAKLVFGIAAAILIFIFIQAQFRFDSELAALLILNLFVPLLNRIPQKL